MQNVKVGLVGAGTIGMRHIQAIDALKEISLVAIADPSLTVEGLVAKRAIPLYKEAQTMFEAGNLDAVIVAAPTNHHYDIVMNALNHHLTVLVEKPITATIEEARKVTRFAYKQGCQVLVGHQRRYYPCTKTAKDIIHSGRIGTLMAMTGQWTVRKDSQYYEPHWRRQVEAGPILTNLIHEIDLLRFICGDIVMVSAEITNHDQQFSKEDAVAIIMKFANNAIGSFVLSDRTPTPWNWEMALGENAKFPKSEQNAIRFMGTKGSLEFPNLVLWSHSNADGNWQDKIFREEIETPFVDAYVAQCQHLCAVVRGTQRPIIGAENGTKSLEVTLAVIRAANEGTRVIIDRLLK